MRNTLFVLALCLAAILAGAFLFFHNPQSLTGVTDQSAQVSSATAEAAPVSYTVLEAGDHSQVAERTNVAARDQASFDRLWTMAHGTQELAMPEVDFNKQYVIGVFAGEKSSGGHIIEVTSMSDRADTRTLSVTETAPGEGCMVTQALTSPYQLIVVPVSMHYLKAVDAKVVSPCE